MQGVPISRARATKAIQRQSLTKRNKKHNRSESTGRLQNIRAVRLLGIVPPLLEYVARALLRLRRRLAPREHRTIPEVYDKTGLPVQRLVEDEGGKWAPNAGRN